MAGRMSRDRWRHVTLKGQAGDDPYTLRAQYLENRWRCYLERNRASDSTCSTAARVTSFRHSFKH